MKSPRALVGKLRQAIADGLNIGSKFERLDKRIDELKINQGIVLSLLNATKTSKNLRDYEFKVFSEWGEDGIVQHLTRVVDIKHKTFVEFGVGDFFESNCRFLLMKDNWKGFVIDGSSSKIQRLKSANFYWKYHVSAIDAFITIENINSLIAQSGFDEDLGLLSIDIEGNDYHVLEAINVVRPRILICEFNPTFGGERKISVPYEPDFKRTDKHYSNLYFGASLAAMTHLAQKKGYALVGTNSTSSNAFFVRNDLMNEALEPLTAGQAYSPSNIRAAIRDERGLLNYLAGEDKLKLIRGLPIYNVDKGVTEELYRDLEAAVSAATACTNSVI